MVKKINTGTSKKKVSGKNTGKSWLGLKAKWWYLVIFVVIVVGGGFAQRALSISAEKNDFLEKQLQLDVIADKIVAINKPDSRESYNYCRYQSGKLEKGDLYCHVGVVLTYKSVDLKSANGILTTASNQASNSPITNQLNPDITMFSDDGDPQKSHLSQGILGRSYCSASYNYSSPNATTSDMTIYLSCGQVSRTAHFRLEK